MTLQFHNLQGDEWKGPWIVIMVFKSAMVFVFIVITCGMYAGETLITLKCESSQPLHVYIPHMTVKLSADEEKLRSHLEEVCVFKYLEFWMRDIAFYTQEPWTELGETKPRHCFEARIPSKIIKSHGLCMVQNTLLSGVSINCGGKYRCAIGSSADMRVYAHSARLSLVKALNTQALIAPQQCQEESNKLWSSPTMGSDEHGWRAYIYMKVCKRILVKEPVEK
jgi:hypothetical protein